MTVNVFFAGVAVKNYQAACAWYERLLGRPPDMLPNDIEAAWRISDTAWMYIIVDVDRAGKALLTLIIDDLEQHVAELGQRGFTPEEIEDVPGKYRKVSFRDPEGNTIAFGQVFGDGS
jgi:catechol 2,3-dioxygenase-like lactoylglutathione lyase family enzyme